MHYFSRNNLKGRSDCRAYGAALEGLDASQNIIRIAHEMKDDLLNGGHWFVMYSVFFAVYSLVYYTLENPTSDKNLAILETAEQGRQILASLRNHSLVAERCSVILKVQLIEWLKLPILILTDLDDFRSAFTFITESST